MVPVPLLIIRAISTVAPSIVTSPPVFVITATSMMPVEESDTLDAELLSVTALKSAVPANV